MDAIRRRAIWIGVVAGLVGGLVLGVALTNRGIMANVAGLFHLDNSLFGWIIHLFLSAIIGGLYGFWFSIFKGSSKYSDGAASGMIYGFVWWGLGAMTLAPILQQGRVAWTLPAAMATFPLLIGYLVYGLVLGITFQILGELLLGRVLAQPVVPIPITHRVVILGSGFGGMAAAQRWETHLAKHPEISVTLISDNNYSLFTPMLAEVASGALEAPHISSSVRAFFNRVRFRRAVVASIDTQAHTVHIQPRENADLVALPYDQLLLSLGSTPFDFGLPGINDYAFTLKTLEDAITLRDHVLTLLEHADLLGGEIPPEMLTFVVAGGGFSGMEVVAELFDFVHSAIRYYPSIRPEDTRFILVHSGEHVLPELSSSLGDYAQHKLARRGIAFMLGARVAGCTTNSVLLKDVEALNARTLIWTTGNKPHPVLQALEVAKSNNRIQTDTALRSVSHPALWAVGDCAFNPDPDGKPYAPTAQNASRSGKLAADNMLAAWQGQTQLTPFVFKPLGLLVVLGQRTAAAEIGDWKFSGLLAWFMWRGIYLSKLPGLEKKVRVLLDWIVEFFFPRDIVLTQRVNAPRHSDSELMTEQKPGGAA
ncbi:MAG: NAD(P)/FAD-dependent oxidoreductase [Chloroflexota bacterium]